MKRTCIVIGAMALVAGCKTIQTLDPETGEVISEISVIDPEAAATIAPLLPAPFGTLLGPILAIGATIFNDKKKA